MRFVALGVALLSACASSPTQKPAVPQEKIILLGSEDEVKEQCNGKVLARRNVNCIFTVGKDHIIVLPRWYLDLQEGKTGQYYKDEAVKHAFLPIKDGFSFADRLSGKFPFAFLKITPKQQDGVNIFSASVFVRKSGEWKDTEDYTDEVWGFVDQALPTAATGSPRVAKYIEDTKQAAAEQAKREARQAYLDRFSGAKTMGQLNSFIRDYEGNDPEGFVPEARRKIDQMEMEAKEQIEIQEEAERLAKSRLKPRHKLCRFKGGWVAGAMGGLMMPDPVPAFDDFMKKSYNDKVAVAYENQIRARPDTFGQWGCYGLTYLGPRRAITLGDENKPIMNGVYDVVGIEIEFVGGTIACPVLVLSEALECG
jgi:hypothetical protein